MNMLNSIQLNGILKIHFVVNVMMENKILIKNKKARAEAKKLCSRLDALDEEYEYSDSNISIFVYGRFFLPQSFYKLRTIIRQKSNKSSLDGWM